jgi:hypothetical protein
MAPPPCWDVPSTSLILMTSWPFCTACILQIFLNYRRKGTFSQQVKTTAHAPELEQTGICSTEPVLLNVFGAPESIPRNEFRQPM